jgi:hypothetical protein
MYNEDIFANEFGLTVSDQSTTIEARVLPPPLVSLIWHAYKIFKHHFLLCLWGDKHCYNLNTSTVYYIWYFHSKLDVFRFPFSYNTIQCVILIVQLKYHDTGAEKECMPRFGAWNMRDKVESLSLSLWQPYNSSSILLSIFISLSVFSLIWCL